MTEELTLAARILLDAQNYVRGLTKVKTETKEAAAEMGESFRRAGEGLMRGLGFELAALKLGMETFEQFKESAVRDKSMFQIGRQAQWSRDQVKGLRDEMWGQAVTTGSSMESLQEIVGDLVDHGVHNLDEVKGTMHALDDTIKVTGASAGGLAKALAAAKANFGFDVDNAKQAKDIFDEMAAATFRGGHLKFDALAEIMGGGEAKLLHQAGFSWNEGLNLAERLSIRDEDPAHVALGLKTISMLFAGGNAKRMLAAQKATGVHFFEKSGAQNDPLSILGEMAAMSAKLKTDRQREAFLEKAFKGTGQRQISWLRDALATDRKGNNPVIDALRDSRQKSGGYIDANLDEALDNMVDQGARLKNSFAMLTDSVARPINKEMAKSIEYLMKSKERGGLGLTGEDFVKGLGGLTIGGAIAKKFGPGILNKLLPDPSGVIEGEVLKEVAGVTPVFVTNWPGTPLSSIPGVGGKAAVAAAGAEEAEVSAKGMGVLGILRMLTRAGGSGTAIGLAGAGAFLYGGAKIANPNTTMEMTWTKFATLWSESARKEIKDALAAKADKDLRASQQNLVQQIRDTVRESQRRLDNVKQTNEERKAELHITIDAQGNAKVNGVDAGTAFSNIETSIRNSPLGRMMSSM